MRGIVLNAVCVIAHFTSTTGVAGGYYCPSGEAPVRASPMTEVQVFRTELLCFANEEIGTERSSKLFKVTHRL